MPKKSSQSQPKKNLKRARKASEAKVQAKRQKIEKVIDLDEEKIVDSDVEVQQIISEVSYSQPSTQCKVMFELAQDDGQLIQKKAIGVPLTLKDLKAQAQEVCQIDSKIGLKYQDGDDWLDVTTDADLERCYQENKEKIKFKIDRDPVKMVAKAPAGSEVPKFKKMVQYQEYIETLFAERGRKDQKISELQQEKEKAETLMAQKNQMAVQLEEERDKVQQSMESNIAKVKEEYESRLTQLEVLRDELKSSIEEKEHRIHLFSTKVTDASNELEDLQEDKDDLKAHVDDLKEEIKDYKEQIYSQQATIANYQSKLAEFKSKEEEMDAIRENLSSELNQRSYLFSKLENQYLQKHELLQQKNLKLQNRLDQLRELQKQMRKINPDPKKSGANDDNTADVGDKQKTESSSSQSSKNRNSEQGSKVNSSSQNNKESSPKNKLSSSSNSGTVSSSSSKDRPTAQSEPIPTISQLPMQDKEIKMIIQSSTGQKIIKFKRKIPMRRLMQDYCHRESHLRNECAFYYKDKKVEDNDTADSLQMDDGEDIMRFMISS